MLRSGSWEEGKRMSMMMWSLWEPTEAALVHVEVGVLGGG